MNMQRKYEGVPGVQYPGSHTGEMEATEPPPADWVHLNAASSMLGKSRATAHKLMDGQGIRYGGRWWYAPAAIGRAKRLLEVPPGYVTAPAAIELLGYCSQSWLESLVDRGRIRVWYVCGRKYYRAGDIEKYVRDRKAR